MAIIQGHAKSSGVQGFYPTTIDQSLRFEDGDQPRIERTPASSGSLTTWTLSWWVKPGNLGISRYMFSAYDSGAATYTLIRFHTDDSLHVLKSTGYSMNLSRVFRDPSAWYHMVYVWDTTNATAEDRDRLYINGERITTFASRTQPSLNENSDWNQGSIIQTIGNSRLNLTINQMDGYMAEVHFTDGTAYDADTFGELKSGIWIPKSPSVTYGTNGFYLDFADGAAIGDDESGNTNDWTATNLVASDVVLDSPTNNFATVNPISAPSGFVTSEGNLTGSGTNYNPAPATFAIPLAGKWYFEYLLRGAPYNNAFNGTFGVMGLIPEDIVGSFVLNEATTFLITDTGIVRNFSTTDTDSILTVSGSLIGLAVNMDAHQVSVYHDNTLVDTFDLNVAEGTTLFPMLGNQGTARGNMIMNFGQDSTFAGNKTAGGNSDANGIGDFQYAPPSGYLALCTSNLPDPVIDPAQEATPDQNFNVYTYVGNGSSQLIGDVVREIPDTVTIDQSLRFDHAGSTYLTFDPASDGDLTEWTFSTWFKRTGADARMIFGQGTSGSNNRDIIYIEATGELQVASYGGSYVFQFVTDRTFNDSAAWYHLVVAYDSSQATDTDRVKIWVNGLRITNFSTNTKPNLNDPCAHFNSGSPQYIGRYIDQGTHWNGYQAETHWIDGTAYAATDFGAYNADGIWTPITPSVTYGTNGWHIDYSSASYTSGTPDTFADQANSNDFSAYGFDSAEDIVPDTPTNQFPVLDSNRKPAHVTLTEGNLVSTVSTAGWETFKSAIGFEKGKWYWEIKLADDGRQFVGVMHEPSDAVDIADVYYRTTGLWTVYYNGDMYLNTGAYVNNGNTFGTDDIMSIAFDADTGQFWLGENGTWYNSGDPASGTNELFIIPTTERMFPTGSVYYTASRQRWNFGADATFAGDDTGSAGPYSDDNSVGEFYYAPPTGFLALCENNLIQYDDNPLESPDWVWIKNREQADSHHLYDSVRGATESLHSDSTAAEVTEPDGLTSFNKNGFVIGSELQVNTSGEDYVAWTWKAGGTGVSNTDGSINSQVSANTDAGFSIVSYTGTGSQATVGHGLSEAPEMVIIKQRSGSETWVVGHESLGWANVCLDLSSNAASSGAKYVWGNPTGQTPTTTTFGIGTDNDVNNNTSTYIAYCFHSVDQYSKVGSYVGNGSADGPFVYTGFRPKWVMIKNAGTSSTNWLVMDSERSTYNLVEDTLVPNGAGAETTETDIDFLSNGFKLRIGDNTNNRSGFTLIYLAFAEQPFKYSNAR